MTSSINANNIDGTYPVAGQDNDSQGFRTNFTNIKNNFSNAKDEIEDLQSKAILKSALTGTSINNNMAGTVLQGAELVDTRESLVDRGTTSGAVAIDFSEAHNYTVTTSGAIELSFTGFPATGKVGRVRVEIDVTSTGHTMELPGTVSKGIQGLAGYSSSSNTITFTDIGKYLFEFWTDDNGTTIHIEDKSRNRNYFQSETIQLQERTPANSIGSDGDVAGMIAVGGGYIYFCTQAYDGSTAIWQRVSGATWA